MLNEKKREFTFSAVIIGILVGIVMTAANVYLGLYAGMTVSASIPAAVIAAAIYRGIFKQECLYQSNIVQTMASAGESLAAGIIFTLPALVIVGAWNHFEFWPTTCIAICGGLLGVVFMIPLRKALIEDDKDLTYPEGVACATVLRTSASSDSKGAIQIGIGLLVGAVVKVLSSGFHILLGSFEKAGIFSGRAFFIGIDISPALIGVGYIVGINVSFLVLLGGLIGWFFAMPFMNISPELATSSALDIVWTLWSTKIRYIGVGCMLVGAVFSIYNVKGAFVHTIGEAKNSFKNRNSGSTSVDMAYSHILGIFLFCFLGMLGLYSYLLDSFSMSLFTTIIMIVAAFPFVAVSSYIVGLVGSSNNPVSGITISVLIATASLFLLLGFQGQSAILATLGVAAIVCCAACTAGDCSQDLKTGSIIGASPKHQQWAQTIGIIIPAFVIAPVLTILHNAYGIGTGLKAPQATLFASITKAFFGKETLSYDMILIGVALGILILGSDHLLKKANSTFRLYLMPIAVGIYLPLSLTLPMFIGGVIRHFITKGQNTEATDNDSGVLLSSGFIAGEAIVGVLLAILLSLNIDLKIDFSKNWSEILSLGTVVVISYFLLRTRKTV